MAGKEADIAEQAFKAAFASLELFKFRPGHGSVCVSLADTDEFLTVIRAASGVNIALEVGWLFDATRPSGQSVGSCFLRLILGEVGVEERLRLFFLEVERLRGLGNESDPFSSELVAAAQARCVPGKEGVVL
ncbi:hypothetical protein [Lysobacter panacisoli]|uniref:Uncharacterized protein n=1 Tax=Lysobacter panacisoli TaxID=1255263 RepID=A0ABP9LGI0_9GAMM|nr:hypothetical protein [Lysobacter panacisoli]